MLHINQRDKKENAMQHLRILILIALMFSIFFVSSAQAQRGPNLLDDCANDTNAFWSLTYQGTEELHDSNSVRVCADVDGELGNIPRVDRISSNNDLISLSVELRTGYQVTFFSEPNFGGEQLVFTDSRTETNPFEVFSYIVEPLQAVPTTLELSHEVITAGAGHTCAVRADRTVVCWGYNNHDQTDVPASVQGEAVQIEAGSYYTCALQADRTVVCWGNNSYGQATVPDSVQGEAVQIAADSFHTCALRADRTVVCWGKGRETLVPDSVQGEVVQIAAGYWHSCALQADRTVVCWGDNAKGEANVPGSVQGETVQIAAGLWLHLRSAGRPHRCVLGLESLWSSELFPAVFREKRCRLHQAIITPAQCRPITPLCAGEIDGYGQTSCSRQCSGRSGADCRRMVSHLCSARPTAPLCVGDPMAVIERLCLRDCVWPINTALYQSFAQELTEKTEDLILFNFLIPKDRNLENFAPCMNGINMILYPQ